MTALLPRPVPLDGPPGSAEAVDDAARATTAAARLLDDLAEGVTTAGLPAWQGRDAEAVDARRARIAALAAASADALHRVGARLAGHADVLREVTAGAAAMRAAQDDEFATARSRVAVPFDPLDPLAAPPERVVAALVAAEAYRAGEHARLTARLDEDAVATVRVLGEAASSATGSPPSDPDAALLSLAALLPAWGAPEVARRGYLLAHAVRTPGEDGDGMRTQQLQAAAREDLDLAADPRYAAAFLDALGPRLTTDWLETAWLGSEADDPRTELLARVLSGLNRTGSGPAWLPGLLDAARGEGEIGVVAGGVGAVLARARAVGLPGPPPQLAAAWHRSLTDDERANGRPTDLGGAYAGADPAASDPLALLERTMLDQRDLTAVARALTHPDAWAVVLGRAYDDPALRDALVTAVADAPASAAEPALRSALVGLGTGLDDADPADWGFDEHQVPTVAPLVASALRRHLDVVERLLAALAAGPVDQISLTALRGLAVLVALDAGPGPEETGDVGDRIAAALAAPRPGALQADRAADRDAVSAAFVAVREHGAQLAYAMEQYRRKERAENRAAIWDATLGVGFVLAENVPATAVAASVAETTVTHYLEADGTFTNSVDERVHHARDEAPPGAEHVYDLALGALGTPGWPEAPDTTLPEKLTAGILEDAVGGWVGETLRFVPSDLRDLAGGGVVGLVEDGVEDGVEDRVDRSG